MPHMKKDPAPSNVANADIFRIKMVIYYIDWILLEIHRIFNMNQFPNLLIPCAVFN